MTEGEGDKEMEGGEKTERERELKNLCREDAPIPHHESNYHILQTCTRKSKNFLNVDFRTGGSELSCKGPGTGVLSCAGHTSQLCWSSSVLALQRASAPDHM